MRASPSRHGPVPALRAPWGRAGAAEGVYPCTAPGAPGAPARASLGARPEAVDHGLERRVPGDPGRVAGGLALVDGLLERIGEGGVALRGEVVDDLPGHEADDGVADPRQGVDDLLPHVGPAVDAEHVRGL